MKTLRTPKYEKSESKTVLIIGQQASLKNTSPKVPFVGTVSYKNLQKWFKFMDVMDKYKLVYVNAVPGLPDLERHRPPKICDVDFDNLVNKIEKHKPFAIIALGFVADRACNKLNINRFKLPHPSPKNRQLNDPNFIRNKLHACRRWLLQQEAKLKPSWKEFQSMPKELREAWGDFNALEK